METTQKPHYKLKGKTPYWSTGIFADWDRIDLDGDSTKDTEDTNDFWDFGTNSQYPVLKGIDVNGDGIIDTKDKQHRGEGCRRHYRCFVP